LIYVLMVSLFSPVLVHGQEPGPSPSPSATATPSPTPSESPTPTQGAGGLPVHGAPYAHLPNLDALKAHPTPVTPQIIEPVPSGRCSPAQPDCMPEPSPSPSPSPTPGQGQGRLRPNGTGDAATDTYAVAWNQGPTRRLAGKLVVQTLAEPGPSSFEYLEERAVNLLQGKQTRDANVVNRHSRSATLAKYAQEQYTFDGSFVSELGRSDRSLNHYGAMNRATAVAPDPSMLFGTPSWDDWVAALLDPINRTGGTDPLSRNFHWSLGLAGLPGRAGLDAGLTLNYNSLVWTKDPAGEFVGFDLDQGFPKPVFRLGFQFI
jgi:hypothetical protein